MARTKYRADCIARAGAAVAEAMSMSDQDAFNWLMAWRWPDGRRCPLCDEARAYLIKRNDVWRCKSCRHGYSLFSGTALSHRKASLQVCVAGLRAVEIGQFSARQFGKDVGINGRAANQMFQRLRRTPLVET